MSKFSERLQEAREAKGWSQARLAKEAGVSAGSIGNWESGTRQQPRSLIELARALDVNPAWLSGLDEPREDPAAGVELRFAMKEEAPNATLGQAVLQLARVIFVEGPAERDLIAHHIAYLIRQGPDERIASAIDALATVVVPLAALPSAPRDATSPQWASPVDLDHEVAETLQDLAVASTTMTPTQRRAMVAALRGIKETSWDTTHTPSGRTITPPIGEPGTQPIYRRPGEGVRTARKTK